MTRIALYQARTGIDPQRNAADIVAAVREAASGGAEVLFTPEMSGLLDRDRSRAAAHLRREEQDEVLAADVIRTSYWRGGNESRIYAGLVWALVLMGMAIIATGMDQPLVLLVIAGCVAAFMMFVFSAVLIVLNRRLLAPPLRPAGYRIAALLWAVALFGSLTAITIVDQFRKLAG